MSYPEPRYLGERGQVSALFRPAPPQPDTGSGGTNISYVAKQESTKGEFGLYKIDMEPTAMGATEHFHRTISESFYVLSGELRLYNGERWVTGGEETSSTYRPAGSTPSRTTATARCRFCCSSHRELPGRSTSRSWRSIHSAAAKN